MDHGEDGFVEIPHFQPQGIFAAGVCPALHHVGDIGAGRLLQVKPGRERLFPGAANYDNTDGIVRRNFVKGGVQPLHDGVVHGVALCGSVDGQLDYLAELFIK